MSIYDSLDTYDVSSPICLQESSNWPHSRYVAPSHDPLIFLHLKTGAGFGFAPCSFHRLLLNSKSNRLIWGVLCSGFWCALTRWRGCVNQTLNLHGFPAEVAPWLPLSERVNSPAKACRAAATPQWAAFRVLQNPPGLLFGENFEHMTERRRQRTWHHFYLSGFFLIFSVKKRFSDLKI